MKKHRVYCLFLAHGALFFLTTIGVWHNGHFRISNVYSEGSAVPTAVTSATPTATVSATPGGCPCVPIGAPTSVGGYETLYPGLTSNVIAFQADEPTGPDQFTLFCNSYPIYCPSNYPIGGSYCYDGPLSNYLNNVYGSPISVITAYYLVCTPEPTPLPCQVITCAGQYNGMDPCQTCTALPTPTPTLTPTFTQTPVCEISINSIDLKSNQIAVMLQNPETGELILSLVDENSKHHKVFDQNETGPGNIVGSIDYSQLPAKPAIVYSQLIAQWRLNGVSCSAAAQLPEKFIFYGLKTITQYDTPDQSNQTCDPNSSGKTACIQQSNCQNAAQAKFSDTFEKYAGENWEGEGLTNSFGYIASTGLCPTTPQGCKSNLSFIQIANPEGSKKCLFPPLVDGNFAISDKKKTGFSKGTLNCGDTLYLLNIDNGSVDSSGQIEDSCPGCGESRIDRYSSTGICGISNYGDSSYYVVKYEP